MKMYFCIKEIIIKKITIVGGGAAGFFAAIHAAERHPNAQVTILEGSNKVLSKVLISGGGRCNVTNTIWKPEVLVSHYPRGHEVLLEPFQIFNSKDTQLWFENQGVKLKTEEDGRVFPVSDDSKSIANALMYEIERLGIKINYKCRADSFEQTDDSWKIHTNNETIDTDILIITTGGGPAVWRTLEMLGLSIVPPVPSLFTFHCKHPLLQDLAGISFPNVSVKEPNSKIEQSGPMLITHEGLSGPAILKLSAWAARALHDLNYRFQIKVNWLGLTAKELKAAVQAGQIEHPKKHVINQPLLNIPKRFWTKLCEVSDIPNNRNYAEIGKKQIAKLSENLLQCTIEVTGKSTNKDEFVTAGGVDVDEIDFTSFSAKRFNNMYLAGEVLNIDGVTGGFNFQAAWTGGYLIGQSV
ncbi:MAG: putative Rossmann fold flavoprotein [Bacteroidia bacterium]|jgi:predicted Rossmann fold flavoprotein